MSDGESGFSGISFPARPPPRPGAPSNGSFSFPSQPLPRPPGTVEAPQPQEPEPQTSPFSNIPRKPLPKPVNQSDSLVFPSVPSNCPAFPAVPQRPPNPVVPSRPPSQVHVTPNHGSSVPRFPMNASQPIPPRPTSQIQPPNSFDLPPVPRRMSETENPLTTEGINAPPIPKRPGETQSCTLARAQTSPAIQRAPKLTNSGNTIPPSPTRWKIEPLKPLKLSKKTKRPDIPANLLEKYVSQDLGNSLLHMLSTPPVLLFNFQGAKCFEIIHGKLFDANYNFFPQPKPPNPWFNYSIEIIGPPETERTDETIRIGEIRLIRMDQDPRYYEVIPLQASLPCLEIRPRVFLFRAVGPRFFVIELPEDTPEEQLQQLSEFLLEFSLLHRMNPSGKYQEVTLANSSAAAINSGGEVLGQGIAKGSAFLGKGLRSASTLYTKKTKKAEPKLIQRDLSEEEIKKKEAAEKRLKGADKASSAFVSGTRGVKVGVQKGFGFVGRTGAGIADGTSQTVKKTSWYQEREAKKKESTPPKDPDKGQSNLTGAVNIVKSSLNAGSSVLSGVKQGTRTVAKDVRESSVTIAEHSKGEEAAAKTRQGFNIAGKTALGGAFVFQLTAVESWHCIAYTGVGAATYDPDKKEVLSGIAWKVGWMTKQGSYMNPWSPRFAVLRTYSISFYKDPKHSLPSSYIKLEEISKVEKVPASVTEKEFCISIQTKSDLYHFSLDLGEDLCQQLEINRAELAIHQESWINSLSALILAEKLSLFKKKQQKKQY